MRRFDDISQVKTELAVLSAGLLSFMRFVEDFALEKVEEGDKPLGMFRYAFAEIWIGQFDNMKLGKDILCGITLLVEGIVYFQLNLNRIKATVKTKV